MKDKTAVVLLHGIWMPGFIMAWFGSRLEKAGFRCVRFSYPSVRATPTENALRLQRLLQILDAEVVHFVGHSLGGLVILQLFQSYPAQRPGRIVMLGTPHQGSHAARVLAQTRLGRHLLGAARDALEHGLSIVPAGREIGVIAGNLSIGAGWLIPGIPKPNDGTVAVSEAELPGASDRIVLPVSHTSMLFSPRTLRQVCAFLKHGRFNRSRL